MTTLTDPELDQPDEELDSGHDDRRYWTEEPDVGTEIFDRLRESQSGCWLPYYQNWLRAYQKFYASLPTGWWSDAPSSFMMAGDGDGGSGLRVKSNIARSLAKAKHALITNTRLSLTAVAKTSDAQSLTDASKGRKILEALWKDGNFERMAIMACLGSIVLGEEFLHCPWDRFSGKEVTADPETGEVIREGNITCRKVLGVNTFRDTQASSFENCAWIGCRELLPRWDLIRAYPEHKDDILRAPVDFLGQGGGAGPTQGTISDRCSCYTFYHRPTPACPDGFMAVLLTDKTLLEHGPLPECYRKVLPLVRFSAGDLDGTPFADTDFTEILGAQELSDELNSAAATNAVNLSRIMLVRSDGTNIGPLTIGEGMCEIVVPKGEMEPHAIQLNVQPNSIFQHLDRTAAEQRQVMGLNDIATGQDMSAETAGNATAMALLYESATKLNSDPQGRYVQSVTDLGRLLLASFREFASEERTYDLVGKHGPNIGKSEHGTGKELQALKDVFVTIDNPLSQTSAGKFAIAEMMLSKGFITKPEDLVTVISTGQMESLTEGLLDENILVQHENEQTMKGETPQAMLEDSHQLHIRGHKTVVNSVENRQDPKVMAAMRAHIDQHLAFLLGTPPPPGSPPGTPPTNVDPRIWAILGQAAPPPQSGPPAPGSANPEPSGPPLPGPDGKAVTTQDVLTPAGSKPQTQPTLPVPSKLS